MLALSFTKNKIAIRQKWDKTIIAQFSDKIGKPLCYFGLPGTSIADLLDWREHLDWITGVEHYSRHADAKEQQKQLGAINTLQSMVMKHGLNQKWDLRRGELEDIILDGVDIDGVSPAKFTLSVRNLISNYDLHNWDFQGGLYKNNTGDSHRIEAIKRCLKLQRHHPFLFLLTLNVRHTLGEELATYLSGVDAEVDSSPHKEMFAWYMKQTTKSRTEHYRLKAVVPLFVRQIAQTESFDTYVYPPIYYQGQEEHLLHFVFLLSATRSALPTLSKQTTKDVVELPLVTLADGEFGIPNKQHPHFDRNASVQFISSLGINDVC